MIKCQQFLTKHFKSIFWFALTTLLFLTYFQVIKSANVLVYDDQLVYRPMGSWHTMLNYVAYIKKGYIFDVQPIRDISYYFDHVLNGIFTWYGPHITNLFLWLGILYIVHLLLLKTTKNKLITYIFTTFYAFSPTNTSTIAWISGRKHILSTLFVLWASYLCIQFIEKNKQSIKTFILIAILFLLSGFSQPINCLFPIWVAAYIYFIEVVQNQKKIKEVFTNRSYLYLLGLIGFIAFIIIIINSVYYNSYYLVSTRGLNKYVNNVENPFGITFLAIGRYFYLCLFPFNALPSSHYVGSIENLVGLILLPLFLYTIFKFIPEKIKYIYFLAVIYFFYPLLPVTLRMTNIFCSDTYLLNAGIGILIIIALISKIPKMEKIITFIFVPYTLFIIIFNFNYVNNFLTDSNIWEYSYRHEPTPTNTAFLASYYTVAGRFEESAMLLDRAEDWNPDFLFLGKLKSENYFKNHHLKLDEKIFKINAIKQDSPTKNYLLSELYAQKQDRINVEKNLKLIYKNRKLFSIELLPVKEQILAYSISTCVFFKISNCHQDIMKYKQDPLFSKWNQDLYDSTYKFFEENHQFNFVF